MPLWVWHAALRCHCVATLAVALSPLATPLDPAPPLEAASPLVAAPVPLVAALVVASPLVAASTLGVASPLVAALGVYSARPVSVYSEQGSNNVGMCRSNPDWTCANH